MKNLILLKKKSNLYISRYLSQAEVDCNCNYDDCNYSLITQRNIDSFHATRYEYGSPINATSCYRCQRHNSDVYGKENSNHLYGDAIDLVPMLGDLDELYHIAKKHYAYVIKYKKFIHCDNRLNKEPALNFAL